MSLVNFSSTELEAELERRKRAELRPELLPAPYDTTKLLKYCQECLNEIERLGRYDDDSANYIFQATMKMFYGEDIWEFVNTHVR